MQQLQLIALIAQMLESNNSYKLELYKFFVFKINREMLLKNGSAVDAAIATSICNGISNPQSMGIGGGFLMLIYLK